MDPTTHRRVFKVSKELDRLALMCEQHKLQMAHRRGMPDWTTPSVPAGVSTHGHERIPTFFAWDRADLPPGFEAVEQPGISRDVSMTVETHETPARAGVSAVEQTVPSRAMWTDTPVRQLAAPGESASPSLTNASAAPIIPSTPALASPAESRNEQVMTPVRQPTIDLTTPRRYEEAPGTPAPGLVTPMRPTRRTPPPVNVPAYSSSAAQLFSPSSTTPSPRYKHGRRLREIDMARPSSAYSYRSTPAGISTVAADRFKKRPSFRSPDWSEHRPNKRLAFLDSQVRLAEEEQKNADRAAASRAATSLSDRHWDNRIAQSLSERRKYVLTSSDALRVASSAAREFLHEYPEENTIDNGQQLEGVYVGPTIITSETPRRSKPASVDEAVQVDLEVPTKSTARVSDHATQTEQLEAQSAGEVTPPVTDSVRPSAPSASSRPRKTLRANVSPQRTNPVLMNPRYPPEPSTFRAQTSYRLDFGDRRGG